MWGFVDDGRANSFPGLSPGRTCRDVLDESGAEGPEGRRPSDQLVLSIQVTRLTRDGFGHVIGRLDAIDFGIDLAADGFETIAANAIGLHGAPEVGD